MKTTIYLETIHLPHGSGGYVMLRHDGQDGIILYEGNAECTEAVYEVLKKLQDAQVDLLNSNIEMGMTRS